MARDETTDRPTDAPASPDPRARRRRGTGRRLVATAAALLTAATGTIALGAVAPAPAAAATSCVASVSGCYPHMTLGLSTEGLPTTTGAFDALEQQLGHDADVALSFTSFTYPFDVGALRGLARSGVMPMITWEPFDATVPTANRYPLRDIAAGAHDAYLRDQARRVREVGAPVAIRFAHEMNGGWYPWGAGVNGNTPADYVAAYRHVHDVFEAEGARDVVWVWSPASLDTLTAPDLGPFYPGDAYVDWAALSVYYDAPTDTWTNTVAPTVRQLDRVAPRAPIYLAETGVLPGATRPAQVEELLGSLLRTPRAIGFTWFNVPSREDWRIDRDAAALSAVRAALSSGWYGGDHPAPLVQVAPAVTGVPRVGSSLVATAGTWRGATSTDGRWLVCTDAAGTDCTAAGTGTTLAVTSDLLGRTVRYEVRATGAGGTTTAASVPTTPVVMVPSRPGRPAVESRSGGARVSFPAAPLGTTHWRLVVDGKPYSLVPVGTADYWLTGMANGTTHTLALTAVAVTGGTVLESPATSGTFVPMTQQYSPYASVTGSTVDLTLPAAPAGAESWLLTVGDTVRALPVGTTTTSVTVPTGSPVTWTLAAGAGRWEGTPFGGTTPRTTGSFTAVAAPAVPRITSGAGSVTFTFPTPPPAATAWRVTVGAKAYADVPVGTPSLTATGLYPGYPSTWTLRAVNAGARSAAITGKAAAL